MQRNPSPILFRNQLRDSKRIIVKMGSAVVTRDDNSGVALGRLASIVEQVSELQHSGKEMVIVTSGATAFGRQRLRSELSMQQTMRDHLSLTPHLKTSSPIDSRAAAAVGQGGLVSLYEAMFAQYGLTTAQVLVTKPDFQNAYSRKNLSEALEELIQLNCIPIVNENDVVAPPPNQESDLDGSITLMDNDSLAALFAVEIDAELLILLSDVDGIYTGPPSEESSRLLHDFRKSDMNYIKFGGNSKVGRGGMESKVKAASFALEHGVSVVIANGQFKEINTIKDIVDGRKIGTFFTMAKDEGVSAEDLAIKAREGGRQVQYLTPEQRAQSIYALSALLLDEEDDILAANQLDLAAARETGLEESLMARLTLTSSKLRTLTTGLRQIAESSYNVLGRTVKATRVAEELELQQVTVPIGVLMVIFESRPDALPQVAALAIASGNGLLLKGGKEAYHSNKCLHNLVRKALSIHGDQCSDSIGLVSSREDVNDLLKLKKYIDLIIPRGSSQMIANIKAESKDIPVLGHAEGVCHVYIDREADIKMALNILIDAKCDYPAACNAMETLLVDRHLMRTTAFDEVLDELRNNGVTVHAGPRLAEALPFGPVPAKSLSTEYSGLECTMELVDGLDEAVDHINTFGSGHTDSIVSENPQTAAEFLQRVDSACVFHNTSTRFADGFRFGLGAEVGISTGRIHARGPVGVEGLLTTKWLLKGSGHTVADFAEGGIYNYLHEPLGIDVDEMETSG